MHANKVLNNLFFDSDSQAKNYLKFLSPKRKWKRPDDNTFVCVLSGAIFRIKELNHNE